MPRLRFRAPGRDLPARELLRRALPEAERGRRERLLRDGALRRARVQGARWSPGAPLGGDEPVEPGSALWLEAELSQEELPPDTPAASGETAWRAWLPTLPWARGTVETRRGSFRFEAVEATDPGASHGRISCVRFVLGVDGVAGAAGGVPLREVLRWAARAGCPVLGDRRHGGVLVDGGLRLAPEKGPPSPPDEPVFPAEAGRAKRPPRWRVSRGSAKALARGHPWVLWDRETGDPGRFAAGALVVAEAPGRGALGLVRVEGPGRVAARVWELGVEHPGRESSVERRVARALARRETLHAGAVGEGGTNAYRLVHGEADGLPGLFADRLGDVLRVRYEARGALAIRDRALAGLRRGHVALLGSEPCVVEVVQLADPPPGELECVRCLPGPELPGQCWVQEAGLRFRVDPGLDEPTRPRPGFGLFLDQRANRARVRGRTRPGGRYANLFCHTGAFSAALLAGGAGEVWSVDLSGPYLAELEHNLKASGLPLEGSHAVRRDARRWLQEWPAEQALDGIVLDPPTAAASGHDFWSVEQGLGAMVVASLERLAAGGWLLVCRNDRRRRGRLRELVAAVASETGVPLAAIESAPPAEDFPSLSGFPEGDAFDGVFALRS